MSDEITGGDIELKITNSGGSLIRVDGLLTCSPPNPSSSVSDSTDQDSNSSEEFIVTKVNPGDISGTCKYIPGNATDVTFREHLKSREVRPFQLGEPTTGLAYTPLVETGAGAVTEYSPDSGETDGVRTSSFTIKVSGHGLRGQLDSKGAIIPIQEVPPNLDGAT